MNVSRPHAYLNMQTISCLHVFRAGEAWYSESEMKNKQKYTLILWNKSLHFLLSLFKNQVQIIVWWISILLLLLLIVLWIAVAVHNGLLSFCVLMCFLFSFLV